MTGSPDPDVVSTTIDPELLSARLFFGAAFPVMKVLLADDPATACKFAGVNASVNFAYLDETGETGVTLVFNEGTLEIAQELKPDPDLALVFSSAHTMNTLLRGGLALPRIHGLRNMGLLFKVLGLLMGLKLMGPSAKPKNQQRKRLKVKLSLYMITTALSMYNKAGVPAMRDWTSKQPDRIYQFTVEPYSGSGVAAWLRVKAGNSKAGRGVYTRRSPFVHFRFNGIDGALAVLGKAVGFVEGVEKGMVRVDGSPEYAASLNDFMAVLQDMLT